MLLCAGLSINLIAHVAHAYAHAHGDPYHRTVQALTNFGLPVLQVCSSTASKGLDR